MNSEEQLRMFCDTPTVDAPRASPSTRLSFMGQTLRRPRGSAVDTVQVNYKVPKECKSRLEEVSKRMGVSASEGLEKILMHLDLDADGLPMWVDRDQLPEALPMAKAS
ncbi:hypothetical protein IWX75_003218 [Arthrobacter sp. CAN_A6]